MVEITFPCPQDVNIRIAEANQGAPTCEQLERKTSKLQLCAGYGMEGFECGDIGRISESADHLLRSSA